MPIEIKSIKGYYFLDAWIIANIIQLATERLCARILNRTNDPCGRQYDQMTQAARSITANIAEGSSRHQTSRETEMKLLDVARASAAELHGDIFFLMFRLQVKPWSMNAENTRNFNSIRLDRPDYSTDWEQKAWQNLQSQYAKFSPWLEHEEIEVALNAMLILCNREIILLQKLIYRNLQDFKQAGGFTENLTAERISSIKQQAADTEAPACPVCGSVMILRTIKRGSRSGQQFWSCSNYPKCNGTKNIK